MLPYIDLDRPKPSSYSLKKLKDEILINAHEEDWLRTKMLSLEYNDGFSFESLIKINCLFCKYSQMLGLLISKRLLKQLVF